MVEVCTTFFETSSTHIRFQLMACLAMAIEGFENMANKSLEGLKQWVLKAPTALVELEIKIFPYASICLLGLGLYGIYLIYLIKVE
jgi:hypothetical protein